LSILVAFFPKCPMCWAVYMSMLGSFGMTKLPYMRWLFPVFLLFIVFHLLMLWKRASQKGYGPFTLNLLGFSTILLSRCFFTNNEILPVIGMIVIFSGSLWNSFSNNSLQTKAIKI
jgi:mercuric ion transport protein